MEEEPFPDLDIADWHFLDGLDGRSKCPKCDKSRKYYCYTCYVPVKGIETKVPTVKLPLKLDIIKHPQECDGKSTAAHAGVLAPQDVTVYTYPVIPDYTDKEKVILIFPGDNSVTLEQLALSSPALSSTSGAEITRNNPDTQSQRDTLSLEEHQSNPDTQSQRDTLTLDESQSNNISQNIEQSTDNQHDKRKRRGSEEKEDKGEKHLPAKKHKGIKADAQFTRVVFIDSTWNQTKKIFMDERLRGLRQVEIKTKDTKFWRHQRDKPTTYLATIEAIYYFLREYHEYFCAAPYTGQYDNILFFFNFMYHKIKGIYDGGKKLKAYQQQLTIKNQNTA